MGSQNKQPIKNAAPLADDTAQPPFDTASLRKGLKAFLDKRVLDPITKQKVRLGSYTFGVYVFYDYDGEPIYVGQTREKLSSRVGRHLTNQRTDAVAMSVLDPFEVCDVELYPVPSLEGKSTGDKNVRKYLDDLEASVYLKVLKSSVFGAVLNEKIPSTTKTVRIPPAMRSTIVDAKVMELRSHPDVRLARRAATLSRLAQIISERRVAPGLRRVLVVQTVRINALAERRFETFKGAPDDDGEADET